MADAADLKSDVERREGSNPSRGTCLYLERIVVMAGYAVLYLDTDNDNSSYDYEILVVFESEKNAWEYIEQIYYEIQPCVIKNVKITVNSITKSITVSCIANTITYKIQKVPLILGSYKNDDDEKVAYARGLAVLHILYSSMKTEDVKKRFYENCIKPYEKMMVDKGYMKA